MDKNGMVWTCDPVAFAREALGFEAGRKQALVLRSAAKRGLLNCSRQWGKSTVAAIKAVHRALFTPKAMMLVVSPSERQRASFCGRRHGVRAGAGGEAARGRGERDLAAVRRTGRGLWGCRGRRRRCAGSRR